MTCFFGPSSVQALREWQAFNDCKRTIDEFLEQLPLFKMLANRAMRPRHWQEIMRATGGIQRGGQSLE
jgi:dynein heavy chain